MGGLCVCCIISALAIKFLYLYFQDRDGSSYCEVGIETSLRCFKILSPFSSESHVIRVVYGFSYETMEVTGPQMVLTMKLTTFAWNVYDGRRKLEVRLCVFSLMRELLKNIFQDLDKWQAAKRITKYPSLLEFLGYSSVLLPLFHVL